MSKVIVKIAEYQTWSDRYLAFVEPRRMLVQRRKSNLDGAESILDAIASQCYMPRELEIDVFYSAKFDSGKGLYFEELAQGELKSE